MFFRKLKLPKKVLQLILLGGGGDMRQVATFCTPFLFFQLFFKKNLFLILPIRNSGRIVIMYDKSAIVKKLQV